MRTLFYYLILLFMAVAIESSAQGYLKTEYMSASSLKDGNGDKFGSGDLLKISGGYNLTFSAKQNERKQMTLWAASINGSYGISNNSGEAVNLNPDRILNASINLTHVRPVSTRWSLLVTLGGGVYSAPDAITEKSILANGGAIFIYKVRDNFDLGVGAGLTNAYGIPIIMPMFTTNWQLSGKYEVKVSMASGMEISGAMKFGDKFKLKLVAIEMDGMSSVVDVNGESMIYASATIRSWLSPEYKIGKSSTLFLGVGGTWARSSDLTKRTLKDFFKTFSKDEEDKLNFAPTGYFTVGFRYGF